MTAKMMMFLMTIAVLGATSQAKATQDLKGKQLLCYTSVYLRNEQSDLKIQGPAEYLSKSLINSVEIDLDRVGVNGYGKKWLNFVVTGPHFKGKFLVGLGLYRNSSVSSSPEAFKVTIQRVKSSFLGGSTVHESMGFSLPLPSGGFAPRIQMDTDDADVKNIQMQCTVLDREI